MALKPEALDQVLDKVLPQLRRHQEDIDKTPFMLGISGLQGSGKSTWATDLANAMQQKYQLNVINLSLDDLYHTHANLERIRKVNKGNPLLQTRGQPGTHDELLAADFFAAVRSATGVSVPAFDKSLNKGQGDRIPQNQWRCVPPEQKIDVIIFEGWCIGFQPLMADDLQNCWEQARARLSTQTTWDTQVLGTLELEHVAEINRHLHSYVDTFMGPDKFHYLVHLDTDDLENVYRWRQSQEHALWQAKGEGMSDDDVVNFVRGYMSSYELYLDRLRRDGFASRGGRAAHLRVVLDDDRSIVRMETIGGQDDACGGI